MTQERPWTLVTKWKTLVTKEKTFVTKGKTFVTKGETSVAKGETLVKEGKNLVTEGKTLVKEGKKRKQVGRSPTSCLQGLGKSGRMAAFFLVLFNANYKFIFSLIFSSSSVSILVIPSASCAMLLSSCRDTLLSPSWSQLRKMLASY